MIALKAVLSRSKGKEAQKCEVFSKDDESVNPELNLVLYKFLNTTMNLSDGYISSWGLSEKKKADVENDIWGTTGYPSKISLILLFAKSFIVVGVAFALLGLLSGTLFGLVNIIIGCLAFLFINSAKGKEYACKLSFYRNNYNDGDLFVYSFLKSFGINIFHPKSEQVHKINYLIAWCNDIYKTYNHLENYNMATSHALKEGYLAADKVSEFNQDDSKKFIYHNDVFERDLQSFREMISSVLCLLNSSYNFNNFPHHEFVTNMVRDFENIQKEKKLETENKLRDDCFEYNKKQHLMDILKD